MRNFGFCLLITSLWFLITDRYFDWINAFVGEIIDGIETLFLLILCYPTECFFVLGVCALAVSFVWDHK